MEFDFDGPEIVHCVLVTINALFMCSLDIATILYEEIICQVSLENMIGK